MADAESKYVLTEGEGDNQTVTLLEDSFIDKANVSSFKYTVDGARDITESIRKNETSATSQISTHAGRTGYAPWKCTYPDGTSSVNFVLKDVVVQYVKTMDREKSKYGSGYIFVGIPVAYIEEFQRQARENSSKTVQVKPKTQKASGYWWVTCDTKKMSSADVNITTEENGNVTKTSVSIVETLKSIKQHILCNATMSINASITSPSLGQSLDLSGGTFYFTFKLGALDILREIDVKAPELEVLEKARKETREDSAVNLASSMIAKLALGRLT